MLKTLRYISKILSLAWKANRGYTILSITSQIYESTVYPFISVFLLAQLLNLLESRKDIFFGDISGMIIFYITATLIRIIFRTYGNTKDIMMNVRIDNYIDLQIDQKLINLDPATFESAEFQNLLAQMDGVKNNIENILSRIVALLDAIFKTVTAVVVVSTAFPIFVPIIFLSTIPSFIALNKYRDKILPFMTEERGLLSRLTLYIKNLLSIDSTSKEAAIFKNGPILIEKLKKSQDSYSNRFAKAIDSRMWQIALAGIFQFIAFAYTQFLNLTSIFAGKLTIGNFTLYFQQTLNLAVGAEAMLDQYSGIYTRIKYAEKFFEFLEYPRIIQSPVDAQEIPTRPSPPLIEFKDVSFHYPDQDRDILKNFNLTLNSGEKVALVGENGAGKTTIIKLLLRFYDVTDGELLVNGINVQKINLDQWYKLIGALFQDFIKYQFTFKENIIFGDLSKEYSPEDIKEAIRKSGADSYLENLPEGMSQVVGKMFEKGMDLSGGQWQKLALARAFFRDAPILILDEPTAAIDAKAEYEIFEKVQKLQKDKTVIIISHRFSTVRNADRILVLDEGKIVEEGNHEKLMKQKGLYAELFNIQAQGYK